MLESSNFVNYSMSINKGPVVVKRQKSLTCMHNCCKFESQSVIGETYKLVISMSVILSNQPGRDQPVCSFPPPIIAVTQWPILGRHELKPNHDYDKNNFISLLAVMGLIFYMTHVDSVAPDHPTHPHFLI